MIDLTLVTDRDEIIRRQQEMPQNEALRAFYGVLKGIEHFSRMEVLEIGGTDKNSLAEFFMRTGARYQTVRLESNPDDLPYVLPTPDFMKLLPEKQFDLIISRGVFERYGISRTYDAVPQIDRHSNTAYLQHLHTITKTGGLNVIATMADPCMFEDYEILQTGFKILIRESELFSAWMGLTELVVFEK